MKLATLPSMRRKIVTLSVKLSSRVKRVLKVFQPDEIDKVIADLRAPENYAQLAGKVVVITGSSRGVGLAVAKAFALKGARIVLNGRDPGALQAAVEALRRMEADVLGVACDVSRPEGAKELLAQSVAKFGVVDVLINNAGTAGPVGKLAWQVAPEEWSKVMDVNLSGPFYCARCFTEWMITQGRAGRIINVSTGATHGGQRQFTPYVVSKCGLEAMAHNLAMDVGGAGVAVTTVRVGSVQTEMTKAALGWEQYQLLPPAEVVAPAFLFAATAPAQTVHGRTLTSWRFVNDAEAEAILTSPLALAPRFSFAPRAVPKDVPESEHIVLDRAENQFGLPPKVREYLARVAESPPPLHRYPEADYRGLRAALSRKLKLPPQCFSFGNGSTDIIERALRVFVPPGEEVISNDPSWFMFDRLCAVMGMENLKAPFTRDGAGRFDHNLAGVLKLISPRTRLIYLVTPSNPVGPALRHEAFLEFIPQVPPHVTVLVDEAYVEYADDPEMIRTALAVQQTDRLVLGLRTFSKFYGLAGFRLGYAFGSEKAINLLARLEMLFNLPTLTAGAAEAALADDEHARRVTENVRQERARIEAFCRGRGLEVIPSQTSMMLVECPARPETFYRRCDDLGLFIPKGIWFDKYTMFPVSIPAHNDRMMQLFASFS